MARSSAGGLLSRWGKRARKLRLCLFTRQAISAGAMLLALAASSPSRADAIKGEATLVASGGFARIIFKLAEDVGSDVTTAGSILVIRFERPVDVPLDKWTEAAPDYISGARRDPDGSAIRLSLARKVTVNTMTAGERVFVDLLPDGWSGPPPALPANVVKELSERARAAERELRQQRAAEEAKKRLPVRVRALVQPTFVRFVFELPDGTGVSSALNDRKLKLQFSSALVFDLADAKVAAPPNVSSIEQRVEGSSSAVDISLIGDVDVHSFREEKNYIVDVAFQQSDKRAQDSPIADNSRPPASPAPTSAAQKMAAKPRSEAVSPSQIGEIVRPTPESVAAQMKSAVKSEPEAMSPGPKPEATKPEPERLELPNLESTQPMPVVEGGATRAALPEETMPPPATSPRGQPLSLPPAAAPAADTASVDVRRESDGLHLTFSFGAATPAASFRRGEAIWLVFDSAKPVDLEPIRTKAGATISEVSRLPLQSGQAIRLRLNRPLMHSLASDERASGANWTLTLADRIQNPPQPLMVIRHVTDPANANLSVPLTDPGRQYRFTDPDVGDALLVVTAGPPVRGLVKRQDFVDFSLLESGQGVAIHPNSDDVVVEISPDKIILGKPGGLTLSSVGFSADRAPSAMRPLFEIDEWRKNQEGSFVAREQELMKAVVSVEAELRPQARLELARFYMTRGMYAEAKGVTDAVLADPNAKVDESVALSIHGIACILIGRPAEGLKDLANPAIGNSFDSQLWKGLAYAREQKWADAREKFKNVDFVIAALPVELQRIVTVEAMRASLEVKDFAGAAKRRSDLEVVGVPPEMQPSVAVLRGRLAEGLGRDKDALDEYRSAANSSDRAAVAEAKLLRIALRERHNEITQADMLHELETLAVTWRGDATEVKTLQMLSRIYSETGRYAESLTAARTATKLQPNSELSRQAQDAASTLFSRIFLSQKGDEIPPIDALSIFYEFRELTPIGRRGDEMIRRLADRLVGVDLLDQSAELLQYQVDHRLEGAARAQVAARLAMVYLTNRKPERAIAALSSTRMADLSGELRQQRLLLESRAQSDIGRYDLALDIISNLRGREAVRLRSDIYWAARRWRESSEQIELYYGDRWRDFKPLSATERGDVIRAVIGYALAEDSLGLARFREKYAPLMTVEADRLAFDLASKPSAGSSAEFAEIAKMAASVDTLDGFLREMKTRFPDASTRAPTPDAKADPAPTGSLPRIVGVRAAEASR